MDESLDVVPDVDLSEIDFGLEDEAPAKPQNEIIHLDIDAVVQKLDTKKRTVFCIEREARQLFELINNPPKKGECFKMISGKTGFSSIAIIDYIAKREIILDLNVSTFRVGKKQIDVLNSHRDRIKNASFITSELQGREVETLYNYGEYVRNICARNGWQYVPVNNHSKIILMRTEKNYYVCETSSNLNENPKLEQYSFENDELIYNFYMRMFDALKKKAIEKNDNI